MDMSDNQFTARMTGGSRHESIKDWEARAKRLEDEMMMQQGVEVEELHMVCEQNGSDVSEDQLVFGWFSRLKET